jgi:carbonic anhydrase
MFQVSNHSMAHNYQLDLILPREKNESEAVELNMGNLLSDINFRDFYNYPGSFTTPPCTEGINWFVIKEIQTISQAQYDTFFRLWAGNATFAEGKGNNRVV